MLNKFSELDFTVGSISLLLLFAGGPIARWLDNERSSKEAIDLKVATMRAINLLVVGLIIVRAFLLEGLGFELIHDSINVLIIIYISVFTSQLISFIIERRFGKRRDVDGSSRVVPSYDSRTLSLLASIAIGVIGLIAALQAVGLDSLLQAGGVIGVIGLFFAMTQSAWAPDLFSGLIILNSRLCEEGDIIEIDNTGKHITRVFRTKFFHTELLDLVNNHRLMIRNSKLRDCVVHNLSRFASAKGLRECLTFNIGYEHSPDSVKKMFKEAFEVIDAESNIREEQIEPEIRVSETGDYAVTWAVFYYTKELKSLISFRQYVKEVILQKSVAHHISLATPVLQDAIVKMNQVDVQDVA